MAERFLSYGRVLRELGVDRAALLNLIRQGFLTAYQFRGRLVFQKKQVMAVKKMWDEQPPIIIGATTPSTASSDTATELESLGLQLDNEPDSQLLDTLPETAIHRRLGQILRNAGRVSSEDIQNALAIQKLRRQTENRHDRLGSILIEMGRVTETDVLNALSIQSGIAIVDLDRETVETEAVQAVPLAVAETYHIVPLRIDRQSRAVVVATAEPQNLQLADDLSILLGMPVQMVAAVPSQIQQVMHHVYRRSAPRALEPVRTPSGRLRVISDDALANFRQQAVSASVPIQRWLAEPTDSGIRPADLGPRVFLAMPFHRDFDAVADLIGSTVDHLGGRSLRIDQVPNLRNIWLAIEREIARSDLLVADFSGDVVRNVPNPNVVTEAAIAFHKYEKPVIVITQSTEGLFFDWRHQFALVYDQTDMGLLKLAKHLANRLAAEFVELRTDSRRSSLPEPDEPV